jgi:hypothetical protein
MNSIFIVRDYHQSHVPSKNIQCQRIIIFIPACVAAAVRRSSVFYFNNFFQPYLFSPLTKGILSVPFILFTLFQEVV